MKVQEKKIWKKLISCLLILLILFIQTAVFPSKTSVAATNGITLTSSKTTNLVAGEIVFVTITATTTNGNGIKTLDGYFQFDNTIFEELTDDFIANNAELTNGWSIGEIGEYDEDGMQEFAMNKSTTGGTEGIIAKIPLKVKKSVSSTTFSLVDINAALVPSGNYSNEDGVSVIIGSSGTTPTTYTITYNKNCTDTVNNMPSNGTKTQGTAYTIPSNIPTRTNYTFNGWNTAANGSGTNYSAGGSYTTDANVTLYAKWTDARVTLTINPDGGTWSGSTTVKQMPGTTYTISGTPTPNPSTTGNRVYFNAGTNGTVNGSISYKDQTRSFDKWTLTSGSGTGSLSGTTYTFGNSNGTVKATYKGDAVTLPGVTANTGYTFKGWYTSATGGIQVTGSITPTTNTTLYAQYDKVSTTLSVNPNGGTWDGFTTTQTYNGEYGDTKTINNPTKTGYTVTFNANGGSVSPTSASQTITFTGWNKSGNGTISGTTFTYGTTNTTLTAQYNTVNITLPTPTRQGYTFKGWYTSATGGTKVGDAGATYTPTSNTTIYAQWDEIRSTLTVKPNGGKWNNISTDQTFSELSGTQMDLPNPVHANRTITLNANGGSVTPTSLTQTIAFTHWTRSNNATYTGGTSYTFGATNETLTAHYEDGEVTLPTPTKDGATFNGWYTSTSGGTRRGGGGDTYTPTSSETLYAQWTEITYTLTIDANGGTWSGSSITGTNGQTKSVANPTPPTGYTVTFNANGGSVTPTSAIQPITFNGWTKVSGPGTISGSNYTFGAGNGEIKANYTRGSVTVPTPTRTGYTFNGWNTAQNGSGTSVAAGSYTPEGNITLYAQWTPIELTVTFNPGPGTVNPTSKVVIYGNPYGNLPTPVRPGYDFDGWYLGNTKITETSTVTITSDTTLVARWLGAEFTVYFDYNGGSGNTQSKTVRNEGIYGTLPTPNHLEGKRFIGWFTDANNGNEITSSTTVNLTSDQTLYAHWETVQSRLTVDPNGGTWEGFTTPQQYTQDYRTTKNISEPVKTAYTITFDANGGNVATTSITQNVDFAGWIVTVITDAYGGTFDNSVYTFGETDGQLKANYNDGKITLPTPTRQGYTFKGWFTSITDGTKVGDAGAEYTPTDNITVYAQWEGVESSLEVDPNGGTWRGSTSVQTIHKYEGNTETIEDPTGPNSYTLTLFNNDGTNANQQRVQEQAFIRWDKTGDGTFDSSSKVYTFGQESGKLTAQYTEGQVEVPASLSRTGYRFIGWNTQADGSGDNIPAGSRTLSNNMDIYAQWEPETYTLYFDPGTEGTISYNSKPVSYGQPYGVFPEVTTSGHRLIGWFDNNGNIVKETDIYNITGDSTLTARYEVQNYTVRFLNDDGSLICTYQVNYGTKVTYEGNNPEATNVPRGYKARFSHWENIEELESVTKDIDVIAKYTFTPIKYVIDYRNTRGFNNTMNPLRYNINDNDKPIYDITGNASNIFEGWFIVENNQFKKVNSIDTSKLENILVYAHWEGDQLYLNSRKYKIGENDIDRYENNDVYLDKIEPYTTVKQLRENCNTNGLIVVKDKNGNIIDENQYVGTGMTIVDSGYGKEFVLKAVVMGDVNGDGKVTISDLTSLNRAVQRVTTLQNEYLKAGDVNNSNSITITDLTKLNKVVQNLLNLTYEKPSR